MINQGSRHGFANSLRYSAVITLAVLLEPTVKAWPRPQTIGFSFRPSSLV